MIKRGIGLLIGWLWGWTLLAQPSVDSLERLIEQTNDPVEQSTYLYQLAKDYTYRQPQKGLALLDRVLDLLPQDSILRRGDAHLLKGNFYGQLQELEQALDQQQQAQTLFAQSGDSLRLMRLYTNMATCHFLLEDYPTALDLLYRVRHYCERHQLTKKLGSVYSTLVAINMRQQDYQSALTYGKASLAIFQANQARPRMGIAHYNIGLAYYELGQLDSATHHLQEALQLYEATGSFQNKITAYNVLASVARKQNNLAQAYAYIEQALALSTEAYDQARVQDGLLERADIYYEWGKYAQSESAYQAVLELAEPVSYDAFAARRGLAQSQMALGRPAAAYAGLYEALQLRDSLHQRKNVQQMQALERQYRVQFQTAQKERANELLAKDLRLQALEATQNRYIAYGAVAFLLVVLLMAYLWIRQERWKAAQQQQMLKSKLLRNQMNPHFIFNALTAIQHFIYGQAPHKAAKYLASFAHLVRGILDHSREEYITLEREVAWLERYLQVQQLRFEQPFEFELVVDEALDPTLVLIPPMLTQPFLENAIEHGLKGLDQQGQISVTFTQKGAALQMRLEDNGRGLGQASPATSKHQSLATTITKERLDYLNAQAAQPIHFELGPNPTGGTVVVFRLPLKKRF